MQGVHCTSDAPFVVTRLGFQRAQAGAYVWQKLMQSGALVGNGTDTPVEEVDPIAGFYASVSRRLKDGTVFFPDQRMSRMEALRSYTINNAYTRRLRRTARARCVWGSRPMSRSFRATS
jgi:predicted amidohydrolase YtcJ